MYSKKILNTLFKKVKERLVSSSIEYRDAYVLNDIPRELSEEVLDLVGWTVMEALRLAETFGEKIIKIDNIYWEKFLPKQTTKFLVTLKKGVEQELKKRGK